jgi:hypothetical protein
MPDGSVMRDVPMGTPKAEILRRWENAKAANNNPAPTPVNEPRGAFDSAVDTAKSLGGAAIRQVGLTGRAVLGGLAQVAEPFTEPLRYLGNQVLPENMQIGNIETATDRLATSVGLPEPVGDTENFVQSASRFAVGFATGGAAAKADDAVRGFFGLAKEVKRGAVSVGDLKSIANSAYKAADDAGVVIKAPGFQAWTREVSEIMRRNGLDPILHPQATAALKRIQDLAKAGQPIKLSEIGILRKIIGASMDSTKSSRRQMGMVLKTNLDKYTASLGKSDSLAGDPKAAQALLTTAREAWSRMSRSEDLQKVITDAATTSTETSGPAFAKALTNGLKAMFKNDKRMRGFTPDEKGAIRKIIMGGNIQKSLELLSKLAPSSLVSPGTAILGATHAAGGPLPAALLYAGGAVAKKAAASIPVKRTDDLLESIKNAGAPVSKETPEWLLPWLGGTAVGTDVQGGS